MECHCRLNACLSSAPSEAEKETERVWERGKIRKGGGRKIRDPFVMGDMRMAEKKMGGGDNRPGKGGRRGLWAAGRACLGWWDVRRG